MVNFCSQTAAHFTHTIAEKLIHLSDRFFPIKLSWNKAQAGKFRHFRTFDDLHGAAKVNAKGLQGLNISGSGQLTGDNFAHLVEKTGFIDKHNIIVIDLRKEPHGFINQNPVSWKNELNNVNAEKSSIDAQNDEVSRLQQLSRRVWVWSNSFLPKPTIANEISTEKALIESLGHQYKRFPIADRQNLNNEKVDVFIQLVKENPNAWLHFHCYTGLGRTTTLLAMYDMLHNAKDVSFDDILARQKECGGNDLANLPKEGRWQRPIYVQRLEFLKSFYQYCQTADWNTQSWSNWSSKQNA